LATKHLDLNLLPIAVALYDELSVSQAARRLGMSQPAVSKALRRLRSAFDDPLFVRGPSGIVPTPRAHEIVRSARPSLRHLQDELFKGEGFDPATNTRPIVLGLSDIAEMAFLPSILAHFRVYAPKCAVVSATHPSTQLADALEKGEIDMAAGYFPLLAQRNFRQRRLSQHGFACLMRKGHRLRAERLTMSAYLEAEHIAVRREGRSPELLEQFIDRRNIPRRVAFYTSNVLSVPFIVMDTHLVATLPYAVVTRFAAITTQLVAALPPFDLTYDLKLQWHRRFDNEPRSIWLRDQLAAVFQDHQWLQPPSGPAPYLEA
jgi:DNA-binding transcriptional LysR family regulator